MDFSLTPEHRALVEGVREVASGFDLEYWRDCDRDKRFPAELWEALGAQGWLGIAVPEEYGGAGLGMLEAILVVEEACRAGGGSTLSQLFMATPIFGGETIRHHGTRAQKELYLRGIAEGRVDFAMALTEPDAGSNTMATRTRAEHVGDQYVVTGQKIWVTAAPESDYMLTIVRTATPAAHERRSHGLTLLVVETGAPGITFSPLDKLGTNCLSASVVDFDGVRVSADQVVGTKHRGWDHLLDTLNSERLVTAAGCVAAADLALSIACQYAREREVFDRAIGSNQAIQFPLARLKIELEAARLTLYKAAWAYDARADLAEIGVSANGAKFLAADIAFRACDQAIQTLGGFGYSVEYHVERLWRDVRLFRLAPVSQEMILNFTGQHVLGLPRAY
jgi:acyl-CoA dehydrogenase